MDKIVIVNRAQYQDFHDSFWESAIVEFSDGSIEEIIIAAMHKPQEIKIGKHNTSWVKISELKAQENKWCAWVEVEVWGKDKSFNKEPDF